MSIIVLFFFCGVLFLTVICLITFIVLGTASISLGSAFLILLRVFTLKEKPRWRNPEDRPKIILLICLALLFIVTISGLTVFIYYVSNTHIGFQSIILCI